MFSKVKKKRELLDKIYQEFLISEEEKDFAKTSVLAKRYLKVKNKKIWNLVK